MFYKVIKNNKIIDVLDRLVFLKYQEKHDCMLTCKRPEAQAILSSDESNIWHVEGMHILPKAGYDTVNLKKIDEYEYRQLKALDLYTPEGIIDAFILSCLNEDIKQFVESLRRLYTSRLIDEGKVIALCQSNIIAEEEKKYILES